MQMDIPQGWRLHGESLVSCTPFEALALPEAGRHVISLVGGGGKTTLLHYIAGCYADMGLRTAVMTTTRMGCPQDYCETIEACRAHWAAGKYAAAGRRLENGKFRAPQESVLRALLEEADIIVIEADGAHRRPLKFPGDNEPVILDETDIVIAVSGLDALGQMAGEVCHRMPEAEKLLGCDEAHIIPPAEVAAVLLSPMGGRKGVCGRTYIAALNKCDDARRLSLGEEVLRLLKAGGMKRAAMTHFPMENRTGM